MADILDPITEIASEPTKSVSAVTSGTRTAIIVVIVILVVLILLLVVYAMITYYKKPAEESKISPDLKTRQQENLQKLKNVPKPVPEEPKPEKVDDEKKPQNLGELIDKL